jgi:hypothetical protein
VLASTRLPRPARPSACADLQIWGGPDQVTTELLDYVRRTVAGAVLATLSYVGMPFAEAAADYGLFTAEVLPELLAHDVGVDIGVVHGAQLSVPVG